MTGDGSISNVAYETIRDAGQRVSRRRVVSACAGMHGPTTDMPRGKAERVFDGGGAEPISASVWLAHSRLHGRASGLGEGPGS